VSARQDLLTLAGVWFPRLDPLEARSYTAPSNGMASMTETRHQSLTPREQELLPLLARGLLNKQAAGILGITEYTVQVHRAAS